MNNEHTFSTDWIPRGVYGEIFELITMPKDTTPQICKVVFNDPATVVFWSDETKTIVKAQPGDTYNKEHGLALCISKKFFGNKGNYNDVFKEWCGMN
jgi:hypothetical protein